MLRHLTAAHIPSKVTIKARPSLFNPASKATITRVVTPELV